MTITVEDMVHREVHYCVSSLVATVAEGTNYMLERRGEPATELAYQAFELASPVPDYEEAARQEGFEFYQVEQNIWRWRGRNQEDCCDYASLEFAAQDACAIAGVDPYEREVYEHWIVSDWFADKLAAKGEKVDKDFAGMTVWARTTTGQAISLDGVIQAIWADLVRPEESL